jgi:hypothetical protein
MRPGHGPADAGLSPLTARTSSSAFSSSPMRAPGRRGIGPRGLDICRRLGRRIGASCPKSRTFVGAHEPESRRRMLATERDGR